MPKHGWCLRVPREPSRTSRSASNPPVLPRQNGRNGSRLGPRPVKANSDNHLCLKSAIPAAQGHTQKREDRREVLSCRSRVYARSIGLSKGPKTVRRGLVCCCPAGVKCGVCCAKCLWVGARAFSRRAEGVRMLGEGRLDVCAVEAGGVLRRWATPCVLPRSNG